MHWQELRGKHIVEFTKNGRKYRGTVTPLEKSFRLTLIRLEDSKVMIEIRMRDIVLDDALFKAETYIMEYAE